MQIITQVPSHLGHERQWRRDQTPPREARRGLARVAAVVRNLGA